MNARRYIVARPAAYAPALSEALRSVGVEPVEVPAVTIEPPDSWEALDRALRGIASYDWVLLTSRSGVEVLFHRARTLSAPGDRGFVWPQCLRWAAIGSGTAAALHDHGVRKVWIPSRFLGEAVADELPAFEGERVLRVRAERASEIPGQGLRARGIAVDDVVAYRTVTAPAGSRALLARAIAEGVEGVIFTSASTVRGIIQLAADTGLREEVRRLRCVAIGPVTSEAIRAEGLVPHVVAVEHSVRGILEALREDGAVPGAPASRTPGLP